MSTTKLGREAFLALAAGQAVEIRRVVVLSSVAVEIIDAQIIAEDEKDIGFLGGQKGTGKHAEECEPPKGAGHSTERLAGIHNHIHAFYAGASGPEHP